MKTLLRKLAGRLFGLVPLALLARLVRRAILLRLEGEDAASSLRFLLDLDNFLYQQEGPRAVAYGGGHHPKHRLTGYVEHFADLAAASPGPYLDIGCGDGSLAAAIARRGGDRVVGIDIAPARIAAARAAYSGANLQFVEGDATACALDGPFGTLILSNILEHLERRPAFLKCLVARYRPKRLLIRVPMFERDWRVPLRRELKVEWRLDGTHETEHTLAEFAAEMAAAGLVVLQQEARWGEIWAVVTPARP